MRMLMCQGLRVDPLNGSCWNGLGLCLSQNICYHKNHINNNNNNINNNNDNNNNNNNNNNSIDCNFAAAQSCFVRATQIDANAPAFANLGLISLYKFNLMKNRIISDYHSIYHSFLLHYRIDS